MEKDSGKFKMSDEKKSVDDIFQNYRPEVIEYDPTVDGDEEHKIRDEHLLEQFKNHKPDLKAKSLQKKRKV